MKIDRLAGNIGGGSWDDSDVHRDLQSRPEKKISQRGARTHDPQIKSLMLYRLS